MDGYILDNVNTIKIFPDDTALTYYLFFKDSLHKWTIL